MSTTRPKLPSLKTPTTATFPSDALLSASSIRTPHSAMSFRGPLSAAALYSAGLPSAGLPSAPLDYPPTPSMLSARLEDKMPAEKTPITPPLAYMDFLKSINPASPAMASPPLTAPLPSKSALKRTSTGDSIETVQTIKTEDTVDSATEDDLDSVPTSATTASDVTDCSCHGDRSEKAPRPAPISTRHTTISTSSKSTSTTAAAVLPLSAPATGPTTFPSLRVPPSPAVESPMRSPWSARSLKSPFDWDAALKAKRYTEISAGPTSAGPTSAGPLSARTDKKGTSVRHIREVVTRTVTYTPRMEPAPRGKRRKLNDASTE
ncbi:hypothetical protein BD289DRAFT_371633 [Coniella lustricola]|uniref:Uncharacterized protein n=1 Tax=Coniella lustricola TaxID=2025994 RepID=A0A2T3A3G2_9PEZI|nr:hypothetical protein BD289DRAFT_371633 [Coniella lustricola]